jgi:hypothetical protein
MLKRDGGEKRRKEKLQKKKKILCRKNRKMSRLRQEGLTALVRMSLKRKKKTGRDQKRQKSCEAEAFLLDPVEGNPILVHHCG